MKNSQYVRNVRIYPTQADGDIFYWGVDVAIPEYRDAGHPTYFHMTGKGEANSFAQAHANMVAYIESIGNE